MDQRTFGFDKEKDYPTIVFLRRWNTCSFCGAPADVQPPHKLNAMGQPKDNLDAMRLCTGCTLLQKEVRDSRERNEELEPAGMEDLPNG